MKFIILLFGLFLGTEASLDEQLINQTYKYIEAIEKEENLTENFWALNEIFSSTCQIHNSVSRAIFGSTSSIRYFFSEYGCGEDEASNNTNRLLRLSNFALNHGDVKIASLYILLEPSEVQRTEFFQNFDSSWSESIDQRELGLLSSINNKVKLDINVLLNPDIDLIINSILFTNNTSYLLDSDFLNSLAETWIEYFRKEGFNNDLIDSIRLINLMTIFFEIDRYEDLQYLLPFISTEELFPISTNLSRYLNIANYSLIIIGRYDESLRILREQLIPLSTYLGFTQMYEQAISRKAFSLYSLGKFDEARVEYEKLYNDPNSSISKSELFNNLSLCYRKLGQKNKYLNMQFDALIQAQQDSVYKHELIIIQNLFSYYTEIKDVQTAISYLNQAEKIASDNHDRYELAMLHFFSGSFYWDFFSDAKKALQELQLAQTELDSVNHFSDYVRVLKQEAEILASIKQWDKASQKYHNLKELSIRSSNTSFYLEALIGLTKIAFEQENLTETSELLSEIKIYPLDNIEFELLVDYRTIEARYLQKQGDLRGAFLQLEPVIDQIVNRERTNINSQTGFWSIQPEYLEAFNALINMALESGQFAKAVQLLDEIKTINDAALYNSPILRAKRLSELDLAQDQMLNNRVLDLRTQYLNVSSNSKKLELKAEIDQLQAQREQILNKIRRNTSLEPPSIWAAQRKLSDEELIIHFAEVGNVLYTSYISRNDIKIVPIEFSSEAKQLFISGADNLASAETDLNELHQIYNTLRLEQEIPEGISKLTVIPDNYLYRIPLEVLPIKKPESATSYGSTRYLIEEYTIKYFTSLNEFQDNTRKKKTSHGISFSAFALSNFEASGNDRLGSLPFATKEVREISSHMVNFEDQEIFLERNATKSSFLNMVSNSEIIHVATHSEVSEQDPLFSTIYLRDDSNDGFSPLYAYELFDANMNNQFIMLNSCSSGSGSYIQGAGVVGVSRALRYAGAKSLALNLWSVNDKSASEFASVFYSDVNDGISKEDAIRSAKLNLLKTGNANPYYWGAYMLIGNPSPLTKKPASAGLLYPIFFVIIIGGIFLIRENSF
ncbi:MAG: CHAT domain-containing protein [Balneola sp.]|nr:MAG: CHAT domain-containing protein [Balneola sp.]